ncbi:hypothetical protein LINPERHAP1_LOCUS25308 [Linum perenne]
MAAEAAVQVVEYPEEEVESSTGCRSLHQPSKPQWRLHHRPDHKRWRVHLTRNEYLDQFHRRPRPRPPQEDEDVDCCIICLEDMGFNGEGKLTKLDCKHIFHERCFISWLQTS